MLAYQLIHLVQQNGLEGSVQRQSFTTSGTGNNLISEITLGGRHFRINRGHGYRQHRAGPQTHPARAGTADEVETAIVNDVLRRLNAGENLHVRPPRISNLGPTVTVNRVTIRYNAIELPDETISISDYIAH